MPRARLPLTLTGALTALLATALLCSCSPSTNPSSAPTAQASSGADADAPASEDETDALTRVIEAEDVVIYVLGVTGSHLPRSAHTRTQRAIERHRRSRAVWADALASRGGLAQPPAAAYQISPEVTSIARARTARQQALESLRGAYRALADVADDDIAAQARSLLAG